MCGPEPVRYWVSGLPLGSRTVNDTVTGWRGATGVVGWKSASVNTRAGATVGTLTELPPLDPQAVAGHAQAFQDGGGGIGFGGLGVDQIGTSAGVNHPRTGILARQRCRHDNAGAGGGQ